MAQRRAVQTRQIPKSYSGASKLDLLLASGGDERIAVNPFTQRNRYGTTPFPAPEEIWFSSSTATTISERGYEAAERAFDTYLGGAPIADLADWFDALRRRMVAAFGAKAQAFLCASGTEAEILALTVAKTFLPGSLRNIVVASRETGNGVLEAATGSHFDERATFKQNVTKGRRLTGWEDARIATVNIEVRDEFGRPKSQNDLDEEVAHCVECALAEGDGVLLHVMDASKTGEGGPTRAVAQDLVKRRPGRVIVVVDACQLRCSFEEIRADLECGFLVMITGSKFAGGPPFCGALLVPEQLAEELRFMKAPPGLAAYSAHFDWPESFRSALSGDELATANPGLGLRWEAALSEIEAFALAPTALKQDIVSMFGDAVRRNVALRPWLRILDSDPSRLRSKRLPTIFPIVTDGGGKAEADQLNRALLRRFPSVSAAASRICHVGQPVVVSETAALRVCISMPMITSIAAQIAEGASLSNAMRSANADLAVLFEKWDLARDDDRRLHAL
jgi:hypothetical protein